RPARANVRRFTPRLEGLEGRGVPGGGGGGVLDSSAAQLGATVSSPAHAPLLGGQPASVGDGIPAGFAVPPPRCGEEMPPRRRSESVRTGWHAEPALGSRGRASRGGQAGHAAPLRPQLLTSRGVTPSYTPYFP